MWFALKQVETTEHISRNSAEFYCVNLCKNLSPKIQNQPFGLYNYGRLHPCFEA